MIKYTVCGNTIIAEFDKKETFSSHKSFWVNELLNSLDKFFNVHNMPYDSIDFIDRIIDRVDKIQNFDGRAECHPEDKFSYMIGSQLAKARLLEKYNKVYYSVLHTIIDKMNNHTDKVIEMLGKKIVSDRRLQHKIKKELSY